MAMRSRLTLVSLAILAAAGCGGGGGGSGGLDQDASLATDPMVLLDLADRRVVPSHASATAPDGILFRRIAGTTSDLSRSEVDYLSEESERGQHIVRLDEFLISTTEITQRQWERLAGTTPWLTLPGAPLEQDRFIGADLPAVGLTREAIIDVCASWSANGWRLRLPSADEWEYACLGHAGTRTTARFAWGDETATAAQFAHVWLPTTTDPRAQPVASLLPNAFGLYDVHGNAWELVAGGSASTAIACGGAWDSPVLQARASNRLSVPAVAGLPNVGVRLVLVRESR